jgi:hypothetical protein
MSEQLIIRDIEDTQSEGYMTLTQHLGKIRCLCLPDTQPTDAAPERVLGTLGELLAATESITVHFEPAFSVNDRERISGYFEQVKHKIEEWVKRQNTPFSVLLEEIYHSSTELRVSLGTFRTSVYVSQSTALGS